MNEYESERVVEPVPESGKEMEKTRPTHSVSFARIVGRDEYGNDSLGPARQIGAIWPRAGKDGAGILRFDHTPQEAGVYFTQEIVKYKKKSDADR